MINESLFSSDVFSGKKTVTGYIMCEDNVGAKVVNNRIVDIINPRYCPVYIIRTKDFEGWLKIRSIDTHRANSRVLRKMLRLNTSKEFDLVLKVHAVTITDTYWFKSVNEVLTHEDVKFKQDDLYEASLYGLFYEIDEDVHTPELTNIGSYEKCWKSLGDEWVMLKKAGEKEMFSEIFIYQLCKFLDLDTAEYVKFTSNVVQSPNFVKDGERFEPMYSFIGEDEDYYNNYSMLDKLSPKLAKEYLDILFMDALIQNPDRHTFNYGLLFNRDGVPTKMAPNFDNNLALISSGYPKRMPSQKNLLIKHFIELVKDNDIDFKIPSINEEVLFLLSNSIIDDNDFSEDLEVSFIVEFIMNNYRLIKEGIEDVIEL